MALFIDSQGKRCLELINPTSFQQFEEYFPNGSIAKLLDTSYSAYSAFGEPGFAEAISLCLPSIIFMDVSNQTYKATVYEHFVYTNAASQRAVAIRDALAEYYNVPVRSRDPAKSITSSAPHRRHQRRADISKLQFVSVRRMTINRPDHTVLHDDYRSV